MIFAFRGLFSALYIYLDFEMIQTKVAAHNLDGFSQDVARLRQEQGGHCLLVGERRVEVVQHLVQNRVDDSLQ